ncbi:hypothetical protein [Nocardioides sp. ChNu-99]|uniref:hypothetical protein n=1 Tax=Nocardioides sp. ChNu-99 TaxID=2839897 RepID=UPI002404A00F|nr:hypothetical protein [Nocardioides sp. ChNu-99]MDF9717884.1 hypothetical protein [Nocardioides sp. ChNu-99]
MKPAPRRGGWGWLVEKPRRLTAAAAGIATLVVGGMVVLDHDELTLWVLGGTWATVWALVLAIAIWHATASDTAGLHAQIEGATREIGRLSSHLIRQRGVTRMQAGHEIGAEPPEGVPVNQTLMTVSLIPEPVLEGFESRTGISRNELRGGVKVYEDASDDVPWVLTTKDRRRWVVSAAGSWPLVSEIH